jgi:hypothetical protein
VNKYDDEDWPWFVRHLGWVFLGFFAFAAVGIGLDQWWSAMNNLPLQNCGNNLYYAQHSTLCAEWNLRHMREGWLTGPPAILGIFGSILSGVGMMCRWLDRTFD